MATPDKSIDPRIFECARKEFLEKGFEKASLKIICENAKVTTGALYKRYSGKEDLFCAIVESTFNDLCEIADSKTSTDLTKLTDRQLIDAWKMGESMDWWFDYLFERYDDFVLLIRYSAGTKYENFQHDWVEKLTKSTYSYYEEAKHRGLTQGSISFREMHILLSAFWTTIYEPFIHGYTHDEIKLHCQTVCRLFDWNKALEFKEDSDVR